MATISSATLWQKLFEWTKACPRCQGDGLVDSTDCDCGGDLPHMMTCFTKDGGCNGTGRVLVLPQIRKKCTDCVAGAQVWFKRGSLEEYKKPCQSCKGLGEVLDPDPTKLLQALTSAGIQWRIQSPHLCHSGVHALDCDCAVQVSVGDGIEYVAVSELVQALLAAAVRLMEEDDVS